MRSSHQGRALASQDPFSVLQLEQVHARGHGPAGVVAAVPGPLAGGGQGHVPDAAAAGVIDGQACGTRRGESDAGARVEGVGLDGEARRGRGPSCASSPWLW